MSQNILKQDEVDNLFGDVTGCDKSLVGNQDKKISRYFRTVSLRRENNKLHKDCGPWQSGQLAAQWLIEYRKMGYSCYVEELFEILYSETTIANAEKDGIELARWKVVSHRKKALR